MSNNKPVSTKENFVLPDYFKFKRHLGSGAYGVVCACDDERTKEEVAVKKITKVIFPPPLFILPFFFFLPPPGCCSWLGVDY